MASKGRAEGAGLLARDLSPPGTQVPDAGDRRAGFRTQQPRVTKAISFEEGNFSLPNQGHSTADGRELGCGLNKHHLFNF